MCFARLGDTTAAVPALIGEQPCQNLVAMHQASLQSLNHACSFDDDLDSRYRRFYADELGIQKSKERAQQFVLRSLHAKPAVSRA